MWHRLHFWLLFLHICFICCMVYFYAVLCYMFWWLFVYNCFFGSCLVALIALWGLIYLNVNMQYVLSSMCSWMGFYVVLNKIWTVLLIILYFADSKFTVSHVVFPSGISVWLRKLLHPKMYQESKMDKRGYQFCWQQLETVSSIGDWEHLPRYVMLLNFFVTVLLT